MRKAAKRDTAEAEIVATLRQLGFIVLHLSDRDVPDLLLHKAGLWLPAEVKTARKRLSAGQQALQQQAPYAVLRSVQDALDLARRWPQMRDRVVDETKLFSDHDRVRRAIQGGSRVS